jgi:hypothetical protein
MTAPIWTITQQDTTTQPYTWGTISSPAASNGRWYGGRDDDSDWSAWADNHPQEIKKNPCADGHDWADTGMASTWCKRCDKGGRWVMGRVEETKETK